MTQMLKHVVSVATFCYGHCQCLASRNCGSILTYVLRQQSKTNTIIHNNCVNSRFFSQLNYMIYNSDQSKNSNLSTEKILLELESLSKKRTPNHTRHDLESKLEALEAFGCTMDQIHESPEILQLCLSEIVKRASALKGLGKDVISVQLLKSIRSNMTTYQLKQKIQLLDPLSNHPTMTNYIQEILKLNNVEMHMLLQRIPMLKYFRNMIAFSDKVEYLRSEGFTTDDFKTHPGILCRGLSVLRHRINIVKEFQQDKTFPVAALTVSEKQFQKFLVKYYTDQKLLKGEDRNVCLAKIFGIPEMIESQMHYFQHRRLATMKPRVDSLLSMGLSLEDIRNHPYIIRYKTETLEKAYAKSQEAGIENVSILHLIYIIICGRVPLKPPYPKSSNYLPELLGFSLKELKKKHKHLRPLVKSSRLLLKGNLDFLMANGFTVEQVYTCPLILSYKQEKLKESLEKLPFRPEMQNNLDLLQDGTMKINLMQYFLEKESNFRLASVEIL